MVDHAPLFADGDAEYRFRQTIEGLLRTGQAAQAEVEIRAALGSLDAAGIPLARRCLATDADTITVNGWDTMVEGLADFDPPITAIGIDMSSPGHIGLKPGEDGCLDPHIETNYYTDDAFAFSEADRAALLKGYSDGGSEWQGCFEEIDNSIAIEGLGELYGAVLSLDTRLDADPRDRDMGIVGACFIAVLVHRAVDRAITQYGLPRPMTVLVGSHDCYPDFDAPVRTVDSFNDAPLFPQRDIRIYRRIGW